MGYYKSSAPEVIAQVHEYHDQSKALHAEAAAFAALFDGAKPVVLAYESGLRFAGLKFDTRQSRDVWRAPDRHHGWQTPRTKPANTAAREEHRAVMDRWKASAPKRSVERDIIYKAIGTSWSNCLFNGIGYSLQGDTFYVETDGKLGDWMVEILGSEYTAATKAKS
jgi:hypothetical protein